MTTYRDAGVDIDAGDEFVERIKPHVRATFRPEVLTDLGGFGGLFRFQADRYTDPVLGSERSLRSPSSWIDTTPSVSTWWRCV